MYAILISIMIHQKKKRKFNIKLYIIYIILYRISKKIYIKKKKKMAGMAVV